MTRLSLVDDGVALSVRLAAATDAGPVDLVRYVYRPCDVQLESPRPYFHPVRTLEGDLVSLFRPHDHVWHRGIAWSLPNVGPHNFWGGPTFVEGEGYVQLENDGSMVHDGFTVLAGPDGTADTEDRVTVTEQLAWIAEHGDRVVEEERTFCVSLAPDGPEIRDTAHAAWVLTFASTLTNVSGTDLPLGSPTTKGRENAGYGGLFWRGPRSFTGGTILAPGVAGGEEIRGSRAPWTGFSGTHDETARSSTLVMVDDPANPRGPSSRGLDPEWFVRTESFAAVCAAPFFSEEIPFTPGDTHTFRYAVVVADGASDPQRGDELARLGRAQLSPPLTRPDEPDQP